MPKSPHSSHAFASYRPPVEQPVARVAWRPSRLLAAILILLGVLAGCAVLASEMPRGAAWCVAGAAWLHGLCVSAREYRRAPVRIVWEGNTGIASIDGVAVRAELRWRGSLAFLRWSDARRRTHRLAFWPDTLDPQQRRALRLVAGQASDPSSRSRA